jgi:hypothetical protein
MKVKNPFQFLVLLVLLASLLLLSSNASAASEIKDTNVSLLSAALPIPYFDEFILVKKNSKDCGPATVAMIVQAYGLRPSNLSNAAFFKQIKANMGKPDNVTTGSDDRQKGLAAYGIASTIIKSSNPNPLQTMIDALAQGKPVIARVNGKELGRNWYSAGHVVVVLGFSNDGNTVFIHDPDSSVRGLAASGGANQAWPISIFKTAVLKAPSSSTEGYGQIINTSLTANAQPKSFNGSWYLNPNNAASNNTNLIAFQYGMSGDIPITGDWNGDGIKTAGIFRPSNATWVLTNTNSTDLTNLVSFQYGLSSDIPVVGDWNGDGIDTVGVFRPSNATWVLTNTNSKKLTKLISFQYGLSSDIPVVGDWNGDGIDTIGVFRPSDASWSLNNTVSGDLTNLIVFQYGLSSDVPIIGDWKGDGIDTVGVAR